ncbi:hypothetical protein Glove_109g407 [Diversispora epigaea]|uniref:Uncharacterized protein n=1 Tax=Diversispora epigaea TaxID=1348612 RepID=A0A397JD26_9GLOM|nr:hypothetical protein Glove_109g407 [Diversispora epigaea]
MRKEEKKRRYSNPTIKPSDTKSYFASLDPNAPCLIHNQIVCIGSVILKYVEAPEWVIITYDLGSLKLETKNRHEEQPKKFFKSLKKTRIHVPQKPSSTSSPTLAFEFPTRRFSSSYSTFCDRAETFGKLKRYEEALNDLNCAIAVKPHKSTTWCFRGIIKGLNKFYMEAIEDLKNALCINDFNEALEFQPNNAMALGNCCESYKILMD